MSLAKTLKERRSALGLTLLDIANKMGVSEATVQRWESGNIKSLRYDRISKLADILHVSPSLLMGWEEKKPPESIGKLSDFEEKLIQVYRSVPDHKKPDLEAVLTSLLGLSAGQDLGQETESKE